MKIGYVFFMSDAEQKKGKASGIQKKARWQIAAYEKSGIEVEFLPEKSVRKWKKALPFETASLSWKNVERKLNGLDGVHIRYASADYQMIRCLKKVKQKNPKFKVLLEIPTYPYDAEKRNLNRKQRLLYRKDLRWRKHLYKVVDRALTFGEDDVIFSIPTIKTINGIDVDSVNVRKPFYNGDSLNICVMADFHFWHGTDRLIKGIGKYYELGGDRNIFVHLIGEGSVAYMSELEKLIDQSGQKKRFYLHGLLSGEELDRVFNQCQLAISGLGSHRKGIMTSSALKTRDYLARGIPFVESVSVDVFLTDPQDFFMQVEASEEPLDINKLLDFHDGLMDRYTEKELIDRIRSFAKDKIDMDVTMSGAVKFFQEI